MIADGFLALKLDACVADDVDRSRIAAVNLLVEAEPAVASSSERLWRGAAALLADDEADTAAAATAADFCAACSAALSACSSFLRCHTLTFGGPEGGFDVAAACKTAVSGSADKLGDSIAAMACLA